MGAAGQPPVRRSPELAQVLPEQAGQDGGIGTARTWAGLATVCGLR